MARVWIGSQKNDTGGPADTDPTGLERYEEQADPFTHAQGNPLSPLAFSINGKTHKLDGKSNNNKKN